LAGFLTVLQQWQTLVGAMVAIAAALIAVANTTRTLRQNKQLERQRRNRKHDAIRAVLPIALAQISDYAEHSARGLNELVGHCDGETLPQATAQRGLIEPLPSDTLETLTDFIEYSDDLDVSIVVSTTTWIQIHDSRVRSLVKRNREPAGVVRSNLESSIIDAASIYAGAGAVYDYARRRGTKLPRTLTWDAVRNALRNMSFWDDQHPRLYEDVARRERLSPGPFEKLNLSDAQTDSA
jgi:hypothetical protein